MGAIPDTPRVTSANERDEHAFVGVVRSSPFGIYVVDADFRLALISEGCRSVFSGIDPLIGRDFAEVLRIVWPEPFASAALEHFRHTLSTGEPFHSPDTTEQRGNVAVVESYDWQLTRVTMPDGRFGVVCYFYETTARVNAEQDARMLVDLGERCRRADDAKELLREATRLVGTYVRADRCFINQIFEDDDRWTITDDYSASGDSLAGEYRLSDYDPQARMALGSGRLEVITDTQTDSRSAARFSTAYEPLGVRAHVAVPLLRAGRWVATFIVTCERPRAWQAREIALLETAAERVWTAVEKLRFDSELRDERQVTELAESALRRERELIRTINDNTSDLIFLKDRHGRLTYANAATRRVLGLAESPPGARAADSAALDREHEVISTTDERVMREGCVVEVEDVFTSPDGTQRTFLSTKSPLRDASGAIVGVIGVSRDISERKEALERLTASEARAELVKEAAQVGFWFCDLPFDKLIWDARVKEHFWLAHDAEVTIDTFYEQLHPDDRARTRAAIATSIDNHAPYDIEYRTRSARGEEKWIRAIGRTFYDVDSRPIRFDGVTLDITDRRRAEEALRENDQRKDEFLAMLAHELRNPLAPILHAAQILRLRETGDDAARWAGEVIERQTQHLTRLVDDLLDLSRIAKGKITLQREELDVRTIIDRAVEANRPLAEARRQQLTVLKPDAAVHVRGDLTRLVQVVSNLLNNAIKYTQPEGAITVEAGAADGHAVIRVRDNGAGIPPALLPTVFELFQQGSQSLDRSQGGLGIGLTLVRLIVDMHGGAVSGSSKGEHQGSEFVVTLPVSVAATAPNDADSSVNPVGADRSAGTLRVLVIEDNKDAAEALEFLLARAGHHVRVAFDGAAGIDAAARFNADVVLCDLGLPGIDGYAVARYLRRNPASAGARLIALSGYGRPEDKRRAQDAGFDDYLIKPVEPTVLEARLRAD